jgi:ribonuclease P/MRP protein subunit POP5
MRRRYLAIKIDGVQGIEERDLKNAIWDTVVRLFGEYGASKTGFVLISYDTVRNYALLRCASTALEAFQASLASLTEIGSRSVAISVLGVSGTLKSLKRKFPPT